MAVARIGSKSSGDAACNIKVLLVGDAGVGKTALLQRFVNDSFQEGYSATLGVDFKVRTLDVNGAPVKLQIWDSAGQERFRSITRSYFRDAKGVIVAYDATDLESFHSVKAWMKEAEEYGPQIVARVIVGNKCDLVDERQVGSDEAASLARHLGVPVVETSARSARGVEEAFSALAAEVVRWQRAQQQPQAEDSTRPSARPSLMLFGGGASGRRSSCCCSTVYALRNRTCQEKMLT